MMKLKDFKKLGIAAFSAALVVAGTAPTISRTAEEKAAGAEQTRHADEQVTPTVEQQKKRTPLGNPVNLGKGKHRFKWGVKQQRKKHTNLKHKSHAAKIKRRKKRNSR